MKVIQISIIQESFFRHAAIIALCDDGSMWSIPFKKGHVNWTKLDPPSENEKEFLI